MWREANPLLQIIHTSARDDPDEKSPPERLKRFVATFELKQRQGFFSTFLENVLISA